MMTHRRRARVDGTARLEVTPMVDVVFLLLVFFVLAVNPNELLARLDVSRPRAGGGDAIPTLRVAVAADGLRLNGKPVTVGRMDAYLTRLGSLSPRQSVIVACEADSRHEQLVTVLDLCAKAGLRNVALFSR